MKIIMHLKSKGSKQSRVATCPNFGGIIPISGVVLLALMSLYQNDKISRFSSSVVNFG
jgi:hypothetical protein